MYGLKHQKKKRSMDHFAASDLGSPPRKCPGNVLIGRNFKLDARYFPDTLVQPRMRTVVVADHARPSKLGNAL